MGKKRKVNTRYQTAGPDGKTYRSIGAMCEAYGIKLCTYYNRIYHGWSREKALTEPIKGSPYGKYGKESKAPDGKTYPSMQAMCRAYGKDYAIFISRIQKGWNEKSALETPVRKKTKQVTDHLGNTYPSIHEMCSAYNMDYYLFKTRRGQGWSLKECLETPIVKRGHNRDGSPIGGETITGPNGEIFHSMVEACKAYGISTGTFIRRRKEGMTDIEALTTPDHRKTPVTGPDGTVYKSKKAMCRALSIPYRDYINASSRGMTISEIISADNRKGKQ